MGEFRLTTPVAIVVFNRLDCVEELMEKIRQAKPEKFYVISDGARKEREGEEAKVGAVREYIEKNIDWKCNVKYNYADHNMGSKYRIYSGLNWVFEQEEQTIILEDDCIPSNDFFRYCQELLQLYESNDNIWLISGKNVLRKQNSKEQYFFSRFPETWGWATWKRAWKQIDIEMDSWKEAKQKKTIRYAYDFFSYRCYVREADYQVRDHRDAWDIPWRYSMHVNHGIGIVPRENMICNIGCGHVDASNTTAPVDDDFSYGKPIKFPLEKQDTFAIDKKYDKACLQKGSGIKKELHYICYCFTRIIPKLKDMLSGN